MKKLNFQKALENSTTIKKIKSLKNQNLLVCRFDRVSFPIDDGVPVLLAGKAISMTAEQLEKLDV